MSDLIKKRVSIPTVGEAETALQPGYSVDVRAPEAFKEEVLTGGIEPVTLGPERQAAARGQDLPELPQNLLYKTQGMDSPEWFPIADTLARARTTTAKRNVFEQLAESGVIMSDWSYEEDDEGRPIVSLKGPNGSKSFYINKPGLSAADWSSFLQEMAYELGLSRVPAGIGKRLVGKVGQAAGSAVGAGAGSAAIDFHAQLQGSDEPIDRTRAYLMGAIAGPSELVLPVVTNMVRSYLSKPKLWNPKTKKLTDRGVEYLKENGVENPTAGYLDALEASLATARNSAEASRFIEAQTLDVPVPLTRGDVTREVSDQALEAQAARGGFGPNAADTMTQMAERQQAALQGNVEAFQGRLLGMPVAGRQGVDQAMRQPAILDTPEAAVGNIQTRLSAEKGKLKELQNAAFKEGRELGANIPVDAYEGIGISIANDLKFSTRSSFDPAIAPKTFAILEQIQKAGDDLNFGGFLGIDGKVVRPPTIPFSRLEARRQQLGALAREIQMDGSPTVEAGAAMSAIKILDNHVDNMVRKTIIQSDQGSAAAEQAVKAIGRGRKLTRELKDKYSNQKLIRDLIRVDDGELRLPPSEAINLVFGARGIVGKAGTYRAVKKLKQVLGDGSKEWHELRQAAFLRLIQKADSKEVVRGEIVQISGTKLYNEMRKTMTDAPDLMRVLFSTDEIDRMWQLARVARRVDDSAKVKGAVNWSNTWTNLLGSVFGPMGTGVARLGEKSRIPDIYYGAQVSQAAPSGTRGYVAPKASFIGSGVGGGVPSVVYGPGDPRQDVQSRRGGPAVEQLLRRGVSRVPFLK